jgi:nicotinamide riboside kinase
MYRRLAISGSAGTGKTTLAMDLAGRLRLPYLEEGFRKRREGGLDLHDLSPTETRALLMELYDEAIWEAKSCDGDFVQDRCPLDFIAFWLHYGFWSEKGESHELFERAQADLEFYDTIIILPWGAIELEFDGIRSTNRWLQLKYQSLFEGLAHRLAPNSRLLWMPIEIKDRAERLAFVLSKLDAT